LGDDTQCTGQFRLVLATPRQQGQNVRPSFHGLARKGRKELHP
jgi:hypothetical protein